MAGPERNPLRAILRRLFGTAPDDRSKTRWVEPRVDIELELLSTAAFERALQTASDEQLASIRAAAEMADNGILARDPRTGMFRVIDEDDVRKLERRHADAVPDGWRDAIRRDTQGGEQSLMSTQALRYRLSAGGDDQASVEVESDYRFDPDDD